MQNRDKKVGRLKAWAGWAKHLRPYGKKVSNKKTRKAGKKEANDG